MLRFRVILRPGECPAATDYTSHDAHLCARKCVSKTGLRPSRKSLLCSRPADKSRPRGPSTGPVPDRYIEARRPRFHNGIDAWHSCFCANWSLPIRSEGPCGAVQNLEVLLCYPGLHAVHVSTGSATGPGPPAPAPARPRFVSHLGRWLTGIEIHPGRPDRPPPHHRPRHGRGDRRDRGGRRRRLPLPPGDAWRTSQHRQGQAPPDGWATTSSSAPGPRSWVTSWSGTGARVGANAVVDGRMSQAGPDRRRHPGAAG